VTNLADSERDGRSTDGSLDGHKVAAARLWATSRHPYLASAIFAAPVIAAPDLGTVVIDRWWRVHVDPDVVDSSTVAELGGELLHLTSHVLRDHATRADAMGLRDAEELHHWVDAADAEICDDFPEDLDRVAPRVSAEALAMDDGHLAEEYYRRGLPREHETNDCGSGAHGSCPDWEPPPPEDDEDEDQNSAAQGVGSDDQEMLRQRVAADIAQADADSVSAGLRSWADEQLHPTVDWRRELAAVLRRSVAATSGAVDYSYRRPSRRASIAQGVILPSLLQPTVEVAVVIDTSASVSEELLGQAVLEVDAVLRAQGVRSVRVLSVDDAVHTVTSVTRGRDIELLGGGGTDMSVGIAAALTERPQPALLIVLTDGWTPWPEFPPPVDVVVGLLGADRSMGTAPVHPPSWARTVVINP